jgi:phosphoribulokinase
MIAVGGDSGTGKTTLCRGLSNIFGGARIETICLDDYHSLDRTQRSALGLTALDPRANNFALMEEQLWELHDGNPVDKPIYDHRNGTICGPERIYPRDIIVVQGLFPLYTRALRALFDVTVWLDPEEELKVAWKVQRDVAQRGYCEAQVREEIRKRQPDIAAHIAPQSVHADLLVRFSRRDGETDHARLSASIRKSGRFEPLDFTDIASTVSTFRVVEDVIELDGHVDDTASRRLQDNIWSHMESHAHLRPKELGTFSDMRGVRASHSLALAQLLIAWRIALVENERSGVEAVA